MGITEQINIFEYADPIPYLKRILEIKQKKNPQYSLRAWAKEIGWTEPGAFSQILRGLRPLPLTHLPKLKINLNLNSLESKYFEAIVGKRYAKAANEKLKYSRQIKTLLKRAQLKMNFISDLNLFQDPIHMVILQLAGLPDFNPSPKWINQRLRNQIPEDRIKSIIQQLTEHGYLTKNSEGRVIKTHLHLTTKSDISSFSVKKFHEKSLSHAVTALFTQDVHEREFASHILAIQKKDLKEAKQVLREFTNQFIAQFSSQIEHPDSLYHLNLNFFSQTQFESPEP